ncbi:hypothetical protein TTHERM_01099110 (macronuclear) [Tetrahymena thermophila SB210]|uniref:Uncharacterized protein n=1 Tax=Tetrahymena thermophila (strain SB210) TaxID=312017 RepID=Q22BK2_TETTS|nr:hypothetical protein TTHERM_01099110 [Tetrahymena thermophila SB210]EAR82664.1 hypothetical protein TTHERM_01099110 [Tetrahymena thermophila SB210]|eukprot:XP_001030327.1 hypothetical protein TTHERM_01099110 [Tetrahymena thermophila SB210]
MAKRQRREDYTIEVMRREHCPEVAKLIYKEFTKHNPVWKKFQSTPEQVIPIILERIECTADSETSSVLFCDNKLVAVQIIIDYVDFLNPKTKGKDLPEMFQVIGKAHAQLFDGLLNYKVERNKVCIFSYQCVDEEYNGCGFYGALNMQAARIIGLGYEISFAITTNPLIVGKVQENQGSSQLRSIQFTEKDHPLYGTEMQLIQIAGPEVEVQPKL